MKHILFLAILAVFGAAAMAQSWSDDFYDALNADDLGRQRAILAQWQRATPDDIDLHIARFNHLINRCQQASGSEAALLADSAVAVIDTAISHFPDRLDLRFGKIYFLGQIMQWKPFADEILITLDRSDQTSHNWQFPNFDQGGRILIIEGVQDYLYTLFDATQNAPAEDLSTLVAQIRRISHRAAQLFPAEPSFLSALAYTHIHDGDLQTALRHLQRAEQLSPNDPAVLQQLVDVYSRLKNKKMAAHYRTRLQALQSQ